MAQMVQNDQSRASEQRGQQQGGSTAMARGTESRQASQQPTRNELARPYSSTFGSPWRFMEDMDRFFDDFLTRRGFPSLAWGSPGVDEASALRQGLWTPAIEVFERDGQLVVRADLPGMTKDDIRVQLEDNTLVLQGERRKEREEQREGYYHCERSYGTFRRAINLPPGVDTSTVNATFDNGVLEIQMNAPKPRGRSIEIRSGAAQPKGTTAGATAGTGGAQQTVPVGGAQAKS
jgi:HSP20 family protein